MSHLSVPNVLSLTPDSLQLLPAWRTLPPRFHRTRLAGRRATLFPISSSRGWRMTVPGSARLYVKASDGQHNSSDSESKTKKSLGGRGGVVGSVLAAIVLAAGVGFTIVYIKKQTALRNAKEMEVLTPHQEELLVADMEDKGDEDSRKKSTDLIDETDSLQNVTALQVPPGKIEVPAVIDQVQSHSFTALQVLKIIELDGQPGDICTRREFARWLVSASSVLSRNTTSKVYPAMYIENVTELAFDDVTPEDPDFPSIQGLAEAGLIASKLSQGDMISSGVDEGPFLFSPESPLSRQDLVSWKIALETRNLPEADRKTLYQASGFVDIDRINPAAWPALVTDLASGDQGIIPLAFGYTRLFQPAKPVTKAQAAIALAIGESSDLVSEELARIEAETMAENAVAAHSELVALVEKELTDSFEKKIQYEREMISAFEKMAEEAKQELEKIRAQKEEDQLSLMKEKAAAELEMEALLKLRLEVDAQLYDVLSNKVEISFEKERIIALHKEVETENQEIARLQYELEIEKKALSMARTWAEDEAKRAREQAKALEEARERWERRGIHIVVDDDLRQEAMDDSTWVNAGKMVSVEETSSRAETLVGKLKAMADYVSGRTRVIINMIIQKIVKLISALKEQASNIGKQSEELKEAVILKVRETTKMLQQSTSEFAYTVTEGAIGVAKDCQGGLKKLTQSLKKYD